MPTIKELYERLARDRWDGKRLEAAGSELDCLLYPLKHPLILRQSECEGCSTPAACSKVCAFDAMAVDEKGNITITGDCVGCGECIPACERGNLTVSRDGIPVIDALKEGRQIYAMIAPAFIGQYSESVTAGKLRCAFKKLGFAGMIEVALFADILTLKEAFEFDKQIVTDDDFLLTSCCCPMWIAMIRKVYSELVPHIPPSVSPMVAAGRVIKRIHPGALTVFIGPCLAKKAEAREKDIADAVDYVLTFPETQELFDLACVVPEECADDEKDHSSAMGRIYARAGGVSEAVKSTLQRISPNRYIPLREVKAAGVPECRELLKNIGSIKANFVEGMGCVGGCVGGPRILKDREIGRVGVDAYAKKAAAVTPIDNPYVVELLHSLGFDTPESLIEGENFFTRKF